MCVCVTTVAEEEVMNLRVSEECGRQELKGKGRECYKHKYDGSNEIVPHRLLYLNT